MKQNPGPVETLNICPQNMEPTTIFPVTGSEHKPNSNSTGNMHSCQWLWVVCERKEVWLMIGKLLCNFNFIPKTWECRAPGPIICQDFRYRMCTLKQIPNCELIWEFFFSSSFLTVLYTFLSFLFLPLYISTFWFYSFLFSFIKLVYTSFKAIV